MITDHNNPRKRPCPACGTLKSNKIMAFTPEQLTAVNPTYRLEKLLLAVHDKVHLLAYSKCAHCGMVFTATEWDSNTLAQVYGQVIDHAISHRKAQSLEKRLFLHRRWCSILRVLKLLGYNSIKGVKLLDFGCGWGDFLDVVSGQGIYCIGYDQDPQKTILSKQRGHVIVNNIESLNEKGPFDLVTMNSVLEHLQDVDYHMRLVQTLLKPGGLFVFSVMDYGPRFIRKNAARLRANQPAMTKNLNPIEHVNVFNLRTARRTLQRFNFQFIATGRVLALCDGLPFEIGFRMLRFLNFMEWLSKAIFQKAPLTVYARTAGRTKDR